MRKLYVLTILGSIGFSACGGEDDPPGPSPSTGGSTATGGTGTGGTSTGGTSTGGIKSTGGTSTGGTSTGGTSTGGSGGAKAGSGGGGGLATTGGAGGKGGSGTGGSMGGGKSTGGAGGTAGKGGGGAGGSIAGNGGGGSGGASTATFKAVSDIIGKQCSAGTCHTTADDHTDLTVNAGLRMRLLGMPTEKGAEGGCKSQTLVVPNMPEKSLLYTIVGENPPCAQRMPYDCAKAGAPDCLSAGDIQTIRDWIAAGAPE